MSDELAPLSDREMELLRLVATGATNQQIAQALVISINTVKVHLRNIFAKLDVSSRTEATMVAVSQGWLEVPRTVEQEETDTLPQALPVEQPSPAIPEPRPWTRIPAASRMSLVALALLAAAIVFLPLLLRTMANNGGPGFSGTGTPAPAAMTGAASSRWRSRAQMPTPRTGLAVVEYDGLVYTLGGVGDDGVTAELEVYDPQADVWSTLTPKPTAAGYVSAVVVNGSIYVPGGVGDGQEVHDVLEIYNPEANTWAAGAPMPEALGAYGLAALDEQIYLFGGFDGQEYVDVVWRYDPAADRWEELPPMEQARGYLGAAALADRIYVVGGYDGVAELESCDAYNPGRDTWSSCASMEQGRGGLALVSVRENLYAIGGGMDSDLAFNERYDPRAGAWSRIETPLTQEWQGLGATFVSPYIYAIGGWGEGHLAANEAYRALYIVVVP